MSQTVDMWTMRWRAPAPAVDNAGALPTAGAFAHITTAYDHQEIKNPNTRCLNRGSGPGGSDLPRRQPGKVGQIYFGVDRFTTVSWQGLLSTSASRGSVLRLRLVVS
jgi:hypothetical protein